MIHPLIYLIAGEPSGDLLGGRLMAALKLLTGGRIRFRGIGGETMRAEGLESLFPQAELSVMGFAEIVPQIPKILRRLRETVRDIEISRPALVITIDSWGFTGRVAMRLKRSGSQIPRLHYVAPMVWAWKESRARQLADRVHRLMCLLPNEPQYFIRHGLPAIHVGHPVLERVKLPSDGIGFRHRHGIADHAPLLCVLPGSRHSETSRLLPVFEETVELMARRFPALNVVIPVVETVAAEIRQEVKSWRVPVAIVESGEKWDAFAAADAALAASGTVALELAAARVPMVIAYRVAPATAWAARRLLKIKYACLVNLMLDRAVIPEFIQENCTADKLVVALAPLMLSGPERDRQMEGGAEALRALGLGGVKPSERAAHEALAMIGVNPV